MPFPAIVAVFDAFPFSLDASLDASFATLTVEVAVDTQPYLGANHLNRHQ